MKSLLPLLLVMVACMAACAEHNYYAEVASVCNYVNPPGAFVFGETFPPANIRPDCKAALEAILPYDEESFEKAPKGFKDKVTEAFQTLIAYPLKLPPENRILGLAPYSIPVWLLRSFGEKENPQESIFNHLINLTDTIVYQDVEESKVFDASAKFYPTATGGGKLLIFRSFVEQDMIGFDYYNGAFTRAGTLVHEARHGDGYYHVPCKSGGGFHCDTELAGPYGAEITYFEMLLHGSGNKQADGSASLLSDFDIGVIGLRICGNLYQINDLPEELASLMARTNCETLPTEWFIRQEGLNR